MSDKNTRYWPLYIGSKKVANAHEQTLDVNGNKSNLFDAEGWAGLAIGAAHSGINISTIEPVGNTDIDFVLLTLQSGLIDVGVPRPDGSFKVMRMGVTNFQAKTNSETGRSDATCTLMGGPPKV